MARDNYLDITGRLTREADNIGRTGMRFSIAYNREWTSKEGEQKKKVDFFNCVCWNQDLLAYMRKGQLIRIEGRLEQSKYLKDGKEVAQVQIVAENITLIGQQKEPHEKPLIDEPVKEILGEFKDDIPF
jgi:single-strand DNA-binding protein